MLFIKYNRWKTKKNNKMNKMEFCIIILVITKKMLKN
jgi:hypothetical protein